MVTLIGTIGFQWVYEKLSNENFEQRASDRLPRFKDDTHEIRRRLGTIVVQNTIGSYLVLAGLLKIRAC